MHIEQVTLKNKLSTLFINVPETKTSSIQIWFRAGSALEEPKDFGIAHFLEHMFFKGTPRYPGPKLTKEIESLGAEVNAFTSFDYTCYYINVPSYHTQKAVDLLLDMVSNPLFSEEDLVPERGVVFEEHRRSIDSPSQFSFKQIQQSCFTGGYSHPILGTEETIQAFTQDQLLSFRKNFYNNQNSLLIVSGPLSDKPALVNLIESYHMPDGPTSSFAPFELKERSMIQIHQKDVKMAQLQLLIKAPPYLEWSSTYEDLALNCFGHGETSRLFQGMVLKDGLANHAGCSTMFFSNGGAHFLKVNFPPENAAAVYKTFHDLILYSMKTSFSKNDVEKIKNQYVASKIYEKESIESLAFSLGHGFAQNGDIYCENHFIEMIKKSSVDSINESFQDIFSRPIHINLQIPLEENLASHKKKLDAFQKKLLTLKGPIKKHQKEVTEKLAFSAHDPTVHHVTLSNNVQLVYKHNPMAPSFVMQAYMKGGLSAETAKNSGIYHLLIATLTKGYKGMPFDKLKNSLEFHSASLNGFSGKNSYGLTMHGLTEHFPMLTEHFFGTLLNPDFMQKYIDHERVLTLRAIESFKTDPSKVCFKEVNRILFKKHPYSQELLGNSVSLKKLKQKDLLALHKKTLEKSSIVICYSGNLLFEEVKGMIKKNLQTLPKRPLQKTVPKRQTPVFGEIKHIPFNREQTQIFLCLPAYKLAAKEDTYLKVLTSYLSGQSSGLFVEMRDKRGLCYAVQPVHLSALEGGHWGIYMASGREKTQEAIGAIKELLKNLANNGIPEQEFTDLKKMIEGQNILSMQTNEDYTNNYGPAALYGLGLDFAHINNQQILDCPYDLFCKFIKKFLNQKYNLVTVGGFQ